MAYGIIDVQKYLNRNGLTPKLVEDGIWGPKTNHAYQSHVLARRNLMRKLSPWPEENTKALTAFYGPKGEKGGRSPAFSKVHLPFKFYLYGDRSGVVESIHVHQKIASAYERVMDRLWEAYNRDQGALDDTGFTNWYGCYNPRPKRGGSGPSMHAWAIATDHDANFNKMSQGRRTARMPEEILDIFETECIINLGRYAGYDFMHMQCTRP